MSLTLAEPKKKALTRNFKFPNLALLGFRGPQESNEPEELVAQDLATATDFTVALYMPKWTNSVSQKSSKLR
jgi:hypothetical protein